MNQKKESSTSKLKCAEIYRNISGCYSFVCYHCAQQLNNFEDMIEHIEMHYEDIQTKESQHFVSTQLQIEFINDEITPPSDEEYNFSGSHQVETPDHVIQNEVLNEYVYVLDLDNSKQNNTFINIEPDQKECALKYNCEICFQSYDSEDMLTIHEKMHQLEDHFECDMCKQIFKTKNVFVDHLKNHHTNLREFMCNICNHQFNSQESLSAHYTNVHGERKVNNFECDTCGKMFNEKYKILRHMKYHINLRQFICDLCNKGYNTKTALIYHIKRHDPNRSKRKFKMIKCTVCCRQIAKPNYENHLMQHKNLKEYECEICHKSFNTKNGLIAHTGLHDENTLKHKCDICDKLFRHSGNLNQHYRRHISDYKYKCDVCNKGFIMLHELKPHLLAHLGDRRYQCDICGRSYLKQSGLNTHKRDSHSDSIHQCPLCAKKYNTKQKLKRHVATHVTERNYVCKKCHKTFKTNYALKLHQKIHKIAQNIIKEK